MNSRRTEQSLALLIVLLLVACGPTAPAPSAANPSAPQAPAQAMPYPGPFVSTKPIVTLFGAPQVAPVGTLRKLHVSIYTPAYQANQAGGGTGVSTVNLAVSGGQSIGSVSLNPNAASDGATLDWMPPATPGDYEIDATGSGFAPALTQVCVTDLGVTIDYLQQFNSESCEPPPLPSVPPGTPPPSILTADAQVDHADCNTIGVVFEMRVYYAAETYFEYIELENAQLSGGGHTDGKQWGDGKGDLYAFYEEWSTPGLASQFPGGDVTLSWKAKAVAATATPSGPAVTTLSNGPHQLHVPIPTCVGQPANHWMVMKPLIPKKFPVVVPTLFAGECPAATYYAPVTDKCIAVQIPPTRKPQEGESGGSCPPGKTYSCGGTGITVVCGCK